MYWVFYDPQAKRDTDRTGRIALDGDLPVGAKHSTPKTSEQLLFLLEDVDAIERRRPITVVH